MITNHRWLVAIMGTLLQLALGGSLADRIGCIQTFRLILGSQLAVFPAMTFVDSPPVFSALVCYVLLRYGGGFGSMPAFVLDVFGSRLMPVVYGTILTAWGCGPAFRGFPYQPRPQR